ncbi:MAG TPA: hypothetical protein VLB12_17135 [Gemmatimonadales bacterium]|nr:hypothetical protein [Gemmatimonadales bacterium]
MAARTAAWTGCAPGGDRRRTAKVGPNQGVATHPLLAPALFIAGIVIALYFVLARAAIA